LEALARVLGKSQERHGDAVHEVLGDEGGNVGLGGWIRQHWSRWVVQPWNRTFIVSVIMMC